MIVRIITYEKSTLVNDEKYIGLDVHQATISVAVMDATGKVVMESILETKTATILEFFAGGEQSYRVRWTPKVDNPTMDEQNRGKVVKEVTAIASYRWHDRRLRTTVHDKVELQLDTTRIRRRLDSKLDSIMGMVPAGLR